jgi:hypothetical protein
LNGGLEVGIFLLPPRTQEKFRLAWCSAKRMAGKPAFDKPAAGKFWFGGRESARSLLQIMNWPDILIKKLIPKINYKFLCQKALEQVRQNLWKNSLTFQMKYGKFTQHDAILA